MTTSLIFLHGGPGYADYMERFFVGRFQSKFECDFYTQRMRGLTGIEDLILELSDHVSANGERVFLIGHSWGGALAVEYLRRTNDPRVRGLVLMGSFLCAEDATTEYRKELATLKLENPSLERIFLTPQEEKVAGNFISDLNKTFDHKIFNKLWDELVGGGYDARDFMRSIKIPVLNVFGEKDIRIPARRVRLYEELSPNICNLEIKEAGHFPFFLPTNRETVIKRIESWIR